MTHAEKLQKIFEAALKDTSEFNQPLTRVFPSSLGAKPVTVRQPAPEPEPVMEVPASPVADAGQFDAASAEPGAVLEIQHQRQTRKRRREALMTLGVFTILTGIGFCWFVQSPRRVVALNEAVWNIRSGGDVGSIVTKYQATLDKIAVRALQIEQATAVVGMSPAQDGTKDSNMNAGMLAMMGGKDNPTGQMNQLVGHSFGQMKWNEAAPPRRMVELAGANSFR